MSWTLERALEALAEHINVERLAHPGPEPLTLDRMRLFCDLMGDPQHAYPVIHITGTNGKGSTSRMATALLQASGLAVGTYTSPHLERINERFAWNGEPIGDGALGEALGAVLDLELVAGQRPHYFEILTAAAFRWFADIAVDAAVIEVGHLGRWDATNVADGRVAVLTNVELDHTDYAGPTREHIAREKVGIVKPGSTFVLGETDPALAPIFAGTDAATTWRRGDEFGCTANRVAVGGRLVDLRTPQAEYRDLFLPLHGAHQGENAAAAVAAAEAFFDRPLDESVVSAALADVVVPGRFEIVSRHPLVILDGAHNPAGAAAAAATLETDFAPGGGALLVVGMNIGRDPVEMLEALGARRARLVIATAPDWARALPADDVGAAARQLGVDVEVIPAVADAVRRAAAVAGPDDVVLVAGSLYVVGEARPVLTRER